MNIIKHLVLRSGPLAKNIPLAKFSYKAQPQFKSSQQNHGSFDSSQSGLKIKPTSLKFKLDQSYWQQLLPKIQEPARQIIRLLFNENSSKKDLTRKIQAYLEFRNMTFQQNVRTDIGCIAVLVAINQQSSVLLQEYESRIVDFLTLSDVENSSYDGPMLRYLLLATYKRMNMNIQKNIRQYYRLRLIDILSDNFEKFENRDLMQLVNIALEIMQKDQTNFITKWRFFGILQNVQKRTNELFMQYISSKDFQEHRQIESVLTYHYIYKYFHLLSLYGNISKEDAEVLEKFLLFKDKNKREEFATIIMYLNIVCYAPYIELQPGVTLRQRLLKYFEERYNESTYHRKAWSEFNIHAKRFLIQKLFTDSFHMVFKQLPFDTLDGKYYTLKQADLKKPEIPEFVWVLFKQHEKLFRQKLILNNVICQIYPQKLSKTINAAPDARRISYLDNEANFKIWEVLDSMEINYKKEQLICQRQVDILIDGKIILQIDGQSHYEWLSRQLEPDTTFRNLHLLLNGYKLVILSVFQYNNNRNLDQLSQLIKRKLEIINTPGIVYVC